MSHHRILLVVSLAASLLMVGVGMIVAILPRRILDFTGSLREVGYIASAFALSYLLLQVPFGSLADRLAVKPFLLLGYLLCAVSGLLFFFAGSADAIFLGRFLQGAGEAPIWALGPALLALSYPQAKGRAIGIYNASIHAGLAAGPLIGLLLFPLGNSNWAFLCFAVLCVCSGMTILLGLPRGAAVPVRIIAQSTSLWQVLRLLKIRDCFLTLIGVLLYGAGYGIFISVLPATLALTKAFDGQAASVFFVLFYGAISIAQVFIGPLSDRHGRQAFMIAGLLMSACGFASFGLLDRPWIYGPLTLASLGLGAFCVASLAFLTDTAPAALKATTSGAYYLFWGIGYFFGPLAVGWLGELLAPLAGYYLLAVLITIEAGALGCFGHSIRALKKSQ